MSERSNHRFQFTANAIAAAAEAEATYHEERAEHWRERAEKALVTVKNSISAKVVEHEVTGGKRATVQVNYGDRAAWNEYELAYGKTEQHRTDADRYRTDQQLYGTQGERTYELDTDDVHHFRLGGQDRPE